MCIGESFTTSKIIYLFIHSNAAAVDIRHLPCNDKERNYKIEIENRKREKFTMLSELE